MQACRMLLCERVGAGNTSYVSGEIKCLKLYMKLIFQNTRFRLIHVFHVALQ